MRVCNNDSQSFNNTVIISEQEHSSVLPQITTVDDNVYVVWVDNTVNNQNIFFSTSHDNGQTFSNPKNLSNNIGMSANQQIAAVDNNVYIVWSDITPGNLEILFTVSDDNGEHFIIPKNLSNNTGSSIQPQIAVVQIT